MGTELEHGAVNDNRPEADWSLRGPDAEQSAWLDYDVDGCRQSFNLGDAHQVHLAFSDYFAAVDYAALPEDQHPAVPWRIAEGRDGATLWWQGSDGPPGPLALGPRSDVMDRFMDWISASDSQ